MRHTRRWRAAALLLPPAIFLVVYGAYTPDQPLINPDSESYLSFDSLRTGGYPFFLSLLKPIIRDLGDYAIAQRWLYAASVLVLGLELLRYLDRLMVAVLAEIVLLANPEVDRYHFAIFTESLFLSMSALFVAAALAHLRAGGVVSLATAAVLAGYLVAIRPTGLAFLPALALLVFVRPGARRRGLWRALAATLVPIAAVIALESVFYAAHHSDPRQSLAPAHLFAKAAMLEPPATAMPGARASEPFQQALASFAPVRRLVAEAPDRPARCLLGVNYESYAQYELALEERNRMMPREVPKALMGIALERLGQDIGGYIRLSADHLICLWTLGAAGVTDASALRAYIDARRPLPFEAATLEGLMAARALPFPVLVRSAMLGIGALLAASGLALLVTMVRGRDPAALLAAGGLCGIVVHAALVLTALTALGIPRYVLGLWVPLATGAGLSALWIVELCASFRPTRRYNMGE
jgi:hypothetical protein